MQAFMSGLLLARGGYWASLRAAMQQLFHTPALRGYASIINESADTFLERIEPYIGDDNAKNSSSSNASRELDIHSEFGALTLRIIGKSAFGLDFPADQGAKSDDDVKAKIPNLVAAIKIIFATATFNPNNGILILFRLLPNWAEPFLFRAIIGLGLMGKGMEYARTTVFSTADHLITNAVKASEAKGEELSILKSDWRWWVDGDFPDSEMYTSKSPYKNAQPSSNSIIHMLSRVKRKDTGTGLYDYQVAAQCQTMIIAGHETSSNALSFAVHFLACHPEKQKKLLEEVDRVAEMLSSMAEERELGNDDLHLLPYTTAIVKETLRLMPPAPFTTRDTNKDAVLTRNGKLKTAGYKIPQGAQVHISIYDVHRDRKIWPRSEEFIPERFLYVEERRGAGEGGSKNENDDEDPSQLRCRHPDAGFIPFGLGPRQCIGYKFALEELVLVIFKMYMKYTFTLAPGRDQVPLQLRMSITVSPKDGLWVVPHLR